MLNLFVYLATTATFGEPIPGAGDIFLTPKKVAKTPSTEAKEEAKNPPIITPSKLFGKDSELGLRSPSNPEELLHTLKILFEREGIAGADALRGCKEFLGIYREDRRDLPEGLGESIDALESLEDGMLEFYIALEKTDIEEIPHITFGNFISNPENAKNFLREFLGGLGMLGGFDVNLQEDPNFNTVQLSSSREFLKTLAYIPALYLFPNSIDPTKRTTAYFLQCLVVKYFGNSYNIGNQPYFHMAEKINPKVPIDTLRFSIAGKNKKIAIGYNLHTGTINLEEVERENKLKYGIDISSIKLKEHDLLLDELNKAREFFEILKEKSAEFNRITSNLPLIVERLKKELCEEGLPGWEGVIKLKEMHVKLNAAIGPIVGKDLLVLIGRSVTLDNIFAKDPKDFYNPLRGGAQLTEEQAGTMNKHLVDIIGDFKNKVIAEEIRRKKELLAPIYGFLSEFRGEKRKLVDHICKEMQGSLLNETFEESMYAAFLKVLHEDVQKMNYSIWELIDSPHRMSKKAIESSPRAEKKETVLTLAKERAIPFGNLTNYANLNGAKLAEIRREKEEGNRIEKLSKLLGQLIQTTEIAIKKYSADRDFYASGALDLMGMFDQVS